MKHSFDLAHVAQLIGEPARAAMLARLLEGTAHTAGELAREAGVTPQTASNHLGKLLAGGLVHVAEQGRHRYYSLARPEVARALEALSLVSPSHSRAVRTPEPLRFARTCYDHLAGRVGVELAAGLERRGYLLSSEDAFSLTSEGEAWFSQLGVDLARISSGRRAFSRQCIDWSERRPHLAGALGAALTERLFSLRWIARIPGTRGVRLTVTGRQRFDRELGVSFP